MDTTTPVDWISLPKDLLILIAKCLNTRIEILRFRAVCHTLRSSVPLPLKTLSPHTSLTVLEPTPNLRSRFVLRESTVYAIEPLNTNEATETWLVRVEESKPGKVRVKYPLCGLRFQNLFHKLPKSLNLLDYRVWEISKVYELGLFSIGNMEFGYFEKVVVSRCLDEIDDEFALMTLTQGKVCVRRNGDVEWTNIGCDRYYFKDIVFHNENFYALCSDGLTITVDYLSLSIKVVADPLEKRVGVLISMVKSVGDLYLIQKYLSESHAIHLNVFKLDEEKRQWVHVMNGLDDRVLFVGTDCSFSLSAKEFSGCKGNCVYFIDNEFSKVQKDYPGWDTGIFDLEDDTASPLSAFPGYSEIFWPPPAWLKKKSRSTCC